MSDKAEYWECNTDLIKGIDVEAFTAGKTYERVMDNEPNVILIDNTEDVYNITERGWLKYFILLEEPKPPRKKYDLVIADNAEDLINTVNDAIEVGYYPKGGMSVVEEKLVQTIYLRN